MEPSFWHERWVSGQIGFHQSSVNPHLERCWSRLGVPAGGRVFVPLCGKSRDMTWLVEHGHPVVGNELSSIAVRDYFQDAGIEPAVDTVGAFKRWSTDRIDVLEGDYFALEPAMLGEIAAVYDRAALIAMPADVRPHYVRQLARLTPAGARVLLVTMAYDESRMSGPPFSVSDSEVEARLRDAFDVERLHAEDALSVNPRFRERGLESLEETVWRLERR
jgi:thiopurine S-methyltransferase